MKYHEKLYTIFKFSTTFSHQIFEHTYTPPLYTQMCTQIPLQSHRMFHVEHIQEYYNVTIETLQIHRNNNMLTLINASA